MKLYGYFRSSAAYRVRIALNLKNVPVEHVFVHLLEEGGQHRKAEFLAKNAQALLPALELNDRTILTQSLAIIEYLEANHPQPRLIPADPVRAAKTRAVALAIACDIHPLNNLRVLNYLKGPFGHTQEDVDRWYRHWVLEGGLNAVEQMIEGTPFCFGAEPTIADICLVPQVFNAHRYKIDISHLKKIAAVDRHCAALSAFAAAHPSQQPDAE
jgi:maleylacetoacetate isomerase